MGKGSALPISARRCSQRGDRARVRCSGWLVLVDLAPVGIQLIHDVVQMALEQVAVGVERGHDRGMAQLRLHRLRVGALRDQQRRGGVSQFVRSSGSSASAGRQT